MNLRKFFLYLLIVSVAVSALLGIGVVLLGNFGDREARILMSTSVIVCTSILGLACGANLEAKSRSSNAGKPRFPDYLAAAA